MLNVLKPLFLGANLLTLPFKLLHGLLVLNLVLAIKHIQLMLQLLFLLYFHIQLLFRLKILFNCLLSLFLQPSILSLKVFNLLLVEFKFLFQCRRSFLSIGMLCLQMLISVRELLMFYLNDFIVLLGRRVFYQCFVDLGFLKFGCEAFLVQFSDFCIELRNLLHLFEILLFELPSLLQNF